MKYALFILTFLMLVGCGNEQGSTNDQLQFDVEIDTVMVNPGYEILLNAGLYGGVLSKDRRYFCNFYPTDFAMEKIDLDNLKFEKKIEVAIEGPHGVGQYFMGILPLDDDKMLFGCYRQECIGLGSKKT